jgi:hypothetical protein
MNNLFNLLTVVFAVVASSAAVVAFRAIRTKLRDWNCRRGRHDLDRGTVFTTNPPMHRCRNCQALVIDGDCRIVTKSHEHAVVLGHACSSVDFTTVDGNRWDVSGNWTDPE